MFPLGNRDLPVVEDKILSHMGPRDLVNAKLVSKEWYQGVRRYLNHLRTSKKEKRLLRKSLLEPVTYFVTINLPMPKRDLCVNSGKEEVYVLSDECVMELDVNKLHAEKKIYFPRVFGDKWKAQGGRGTRELTSTANGDFEVKQEMFGYAYDHQNQRPMPGFSQLLFKRTKSGSLLEYVGRNELCPASPENGITSSCPTETGITK